MATTLGRTLATAGRELAQMIDPVQFARRAGVIPDPWQAEVLRSSVPRILLNCSRQSGKSTTVAVRAVYEALYVPDSLTLCLAPSQRQSGELFRRILQVWRAVGKPVDADAESRLQLELSNGSRLVALPGKEGTIRSYSGVSLLLIDEASLVSDDTYQSVKPMLAVSNGRLIALSTPHGTRGWWHAAWTSPDEPWQRVKVTADQCPRIDPAWLAAERRSIGDWWWLQEYMAEFQDAQTSLFRSSDVDRMFSQEIEQWDL